MYQNVHTCVYTVAACLYYLSMDPLEIDCSSRFLGVLLVATRSVCLVNRSDILSLPVTSLSIGKVFHREPFVAKRSQDNFGGYVFIINPILIRVYPRKRGWLDLPHFVSNLSNSHSPSRLIHGVLFLQTNALALLLHLRFHRGLHMGSRGVASLPSRASFPPNFSKWERL